MNGTGQRISIGVFISILAVASSGPVWSAAVVFPSITVTPGAGNTSTITATFSLRQAAFGGTPGGQIVNLTVNFFEKDVRYDDPIGCTTVAVVLPSSGATTGPFTTPPVCFKPSSLGNGFSLEYRASVKGGSGVGGVTFALATPPPVPGAAETDLGFASLSPPPDILNDPTLGAIFGDATGNVSLANGSVAISMADENEVSTVPTLPSTGLPHEIYEAWVVGSNGDVAFQFPTAGGIPNDGEDATFANDLTFAGFPVFEWADVSTIGAIESVLVTLVDQDGIESPIVILETHPLSFIRSDADNNGEFNGLADGLYTLRAQFIPGSPQWMCREAADADGNGTIDGLNDALYTLNAAFVPTSPSPPAPFPDCGTDPNQAGNLGNTLGCEIPPLRCNRAPTPCAPVSGLQCFTSGRDVWMDWALGDTYDSSKIYRDNRLISIQPGDVTSFTDIGVPAGSYTYQVVGDCGAGTVDRPVRCSVDHMPTTGDPVVNEWFIQTPVEDMTTAEGLLVLATTSFAEVRDLFGNPTAPFTIPDPDSGVPTQGIFYDGTNLGWLKRGAVVATDMDGNTQFAYTLFASGDFHGATYAPQSNSIWTYNAITERYQEFIHPGGTPTGNTIANPCGPGALSGGITQVPGCFDVVCGDSSTDTIFRCDGVSTCGNARDVSVGPEIRGITFHETGTTDTPVLFLHESSTQTVYEVERNP